jgi:hypothetical protein
MVSGYTRGAGWAHRAAACSHARVRHLARRARAVVTERRQRAICRRFVTTARMMAELRACALRIRSSSTSTYDNDYDPQQGARCRHKTSTARHLSTFCDDSGVGPCAKGGLGCSRSTFRMKTLVRSRDRCALNATARRRHGTQGTGHTGHRAQSTEHGARNTGHPGTGHRAQGTGHGAEQGTGRARREATARSIRHRTAQP